MNCFGRFSVQPRVFLLFLLVVIALVVSPPAYGQQPPTPGASPAGQVVPARDAASPQFQAVIAAVEGAMKQSGVPGAVVGIYANGREETAALGVADIATNRPTTTDTRFQIGSINKPYTATAIMRLVEDGRLELDAPVRAYLPEFSLEDEAVAERVTIRQLLNHSGGWWGDAFVDTGDDEHAISDYVARVLPRLPQVAPLGRYFNYNNAGYVVLGRIIEEVTGQDYRETMDELVLDPLGLESATFEPDDVLGAPHADGHGPGADGATQPVTPLFLPRAVDPAGGLWMTVGDQLKFARFHLGNGSVDGEHVLEAKSLELMRTRDIAYSGQPGAYIGLPWILADINGVTLVDHDGGTFGQVSKLTLIPQRDFAIAVMTNSQNGGAVVQAAVETALGQYFGAGGDAGTPPPAQPAATPPEQPPPEALEAYAGRYVLPNGVHNVTLQNGGLVTTFEPQYWPGLVQPSNADEVPPLPPLPIVFVGPDLAVLGSIEAPLQSLAFLRREDGSVGWIVDTGRLYPRED